jgi:hypothetical protein
MDGARDEIPREEPSRPATVDNLKSSTHADSPSEHESQKDSSCPATIELGGRSSTYPKARSSEGTGPILPLAPPQLAGRLALPARAL